MQSLKSRVMGDEIVLASNIRDEAGVKNAIYGVSKYKGRMIALLDPQDAAIMPADTQLDLEEMLRYYGENRIPHIDKNRIIYVNQTEGQTLSSAMIEQRINLCRVLGEMNITKLVPFIYSKEIEEVARKLGLNLATSSRSSEIVNNKHISQTELRARGVSTPLGKLVYTLDQAQQFTKELVEQGYDEVAFKFTRAASGAGVFRITPDQITEYMVTHAREAQQHGILIDGWLQGRQIASPNIQYYIGESAVQDHFISCTDQILNGTAHQGNINAPEILDWPRVQQDVDKIREWVRSVGYTGIIGVDLSINIDGISISMPYYMETNARINGSTTGALIVDKLIGNTKASPWGVHNAISVPFGSNMNDFLSRLDRERMAFDPIKKWGVLLTNTTAIGSHGKAMAVVLGNSNGEVKDMLSTLQSKPQKVEVAA